MALRCALLDMTPEQQRIAIAEACGWTEVMNRMDYDGCGGERSLCGLHPDDFGTGNSHQDCPDYLNDLNAMREAEEVLWDGRTAQHPSRPDQLPIAAHHYYWNWLWIVTHRDVECLKFRETDVKEFGGLFVGEPVGRDYGLLARATASQRAEAFLRCLGLWTGEAQK